MRAAQRRAAPRRRRTPPLRLRRYVLQAPRRRGDPPPRATQRACARAAAPRRKGPGAGRSRAQRAVPPCAPPRPRQQRQLRRGRHGHHRYLLASPSAAASSRGEARRPPPPPPPPRCTPASCPRPCLHPTRRTRPLKAAQAAAARSPRRQCGGTQGCNALLLVAGGRLGEAALRLPSADRPAACLQQNPGHGAGGDTLWRSGDTGDPGRRRRSIDVPSDRRAPPAHDEVSVRNC